MLRREFLAAALPFAGLFRRCRQWTDLMSTGVPAHDPDLISPISMAPHDDYRIYTVGNFRVTLGTPRAAHTSTGPADYAWFAGMHQYPTGEILLRWSYNADANTPGITKNKLSTDGGATFDPASIYSNTGKPSPLEPMVMESSGTFHGGEFWQWSWIDASRRQIRCGYQSITNGGRTYTYTANGVTITGFPQDIGEQYGAGFPAVSWTDRAIRVSDVEWYSTIQAMVVNEYQVYSYGLKSTDQGHTWAVVGQLNTHIIGNEGYSEVGTIRDGSRFISICRTGVSSDARCYSDNNMVTWTPTGSVADIDQGIGAWFKSPYFAKLGSGDYALLTGPVAQYLLDSGDARAHLGLYLSSNVLANTWPVVDLFTHHNRMVDSTLAFDDSVNISTGYMSQIELSSTATTSRLLISYDQAGGSYGLSTRPNRIFVINATIERLS